MRPAHTVFVDANVFYGIRVTSLLLHLAQSNMFRSRWSDRVHREWIDNLHRNRNIPRERLEKRRQAIDASVLDCLVTGYQPLEERYVLPDPNDRHVLAGAVTAGADLLLTFNLTDFPPDVLLECGLTAVHPDDFFLTVFGLSAEAFIERVKADFHHYKTPPLTSGQYLEDLRKAGLPKTALLIKNLKILIDEV